MFDCRFIQTLEMKKKFQIFYIFHQCQTFFNHIMLLKVTVCFCELLNSEKRLIFTHTHGGEKPCGPDVLMVIKQRFFSKTLIIDFATIWKVTHTGQCTK